MTAPANSPKTAPLVGPVLVTGGCGFLGWHLVGALLADPEVGGPVYVLDLKTTQNTHPGAVYIRGSVTDPEAVLSAVLDRTRPSVVFHAASPNATYSPVATFHATNVVGTRTLLGLARAKPYVAALVYTSSVDIYADPPHRRIDESHPLWPERPAPWRGVTEYDQTKTAAHRLVLAANDPPRLKTAVIVPSNIWGVRDSQTLSLFFDIFADPRRPLWQVGSGNVISTAEAGGCADAHLLAAKALLDPSRARGEGRRRGGVDGEAFNVTDGVDVSFADHMRARCALIRAGPGGAGGKVPRTIVVPPLLYGFLVGLIKWVLLICTLGTVEPPLAFTRNGFSWCVQDHTLDDSKAREWLGYRPRNIDREKVMAEAVEFERERRRSVAKKID